MDDFEKYKNLAEKPDYRKDLEFAMYGASNYGMRAMDILCTSEVFGDDYPKILKEAINKSMSLGGAVMKTNSVCKKFLMNIGIPTECPTFRLSDMKDKCADVIRAREAEKLMYKLSIKLSSKQETRQQSMKMKI